MTQIPLRFSSASASKHVWLLCLWYPETDLYSAWKEAGFLQFGMYVAGMYVAEILEIYTALQKDHTPILVMYLEGACQP